MKILGIDPGSVATGIGLINLEKNNVNLIDYDTIKLGNKKDFLLRLKIIYDNCILKIKKFKPDHLAIETAFFGKNIQSTLKLGQARGVAIIAALNSGLEVYEYSPREVKKSVTGNGAASKQQVQNLVRKILNIKETYFFLDSSDALAIALCHSNLLINASSNGRRYFASIKKEIGWGEFIKNNPGKIISTNK